MQHTAPVHIPVLLEEVRSHLGLSPGDIAVDCTAGYGGHLQLLLDQVGPSGKVIAFDRDPNAIEYLNKKFKETIQQNRLLLRNKVFSQIKPSLDELGFTGQVATILADIGVSSPQVDLAERGFSMVHDGPLDMRMNPEEASETAADIVNTYTEGELCRIFWDYGEEPKAKFIARAICKNREQAPIDSTAQLSKIVEDAVYYKTKSRTHPATRTFQALRIAVNHELDELGILCNEGFECLKSKGRLLVISFHSLEDRLIKQRFNRLAKGKELPKEMRTLPLSADEVSKLKDVRARILKPFPMTASPAELTMNSRSRSAKLRVIEKN